MSDRVFQGGSARRLARIGVVGALLSVGCGGLSIEQEVELPKCSDPAGSPLSCGLYGAFLWRNESELWGYSGTSGPLSRRKDGKWEFVTVCEAGEVGLGLGFKGEEIFFLCGQRLVRQDAAGSRSEVALPAGELARSIAPLNGDFLVRGSSGYFGWSGSQFEPVAPLSGSDPSEAGAGLTRSAFYSTSGLFWNGKEWSPIKSSTSGSPPPIDPARVRYADGLMCTGLYVMNGLNWTSLVAGIQLGDRSEDLWPLDTPDCSSVIFGKASGWGDEVESELWIGEQGGEIEELGSMPTELLDTPGVNDTSGNARFWPMYAIDAETLLVQVWKNDPAYDRLVEVGF